MTISFEKIISSKPFQFIVGPDHKSFTIHAALVSDCSGPLSVLINGPMCEAQDGIAKLEDIDEQTFIRFCEYTYTGDYTPAQHNTTLATSNIDIKTSPDDTDSFSVSKIASKKKNKKGKSLWDVHDESVSCGHCGHLINEPPLPSTKEILWEKFQHRHYSSPSLRFRPSRDLEECENDTSLFLCHARVYVFAEKYDVAELRLLALDKLHHTLKSFQINSDRIKDIVNLLRFTYSNDNTRDNEVGQNIDSLRSMVVDYVTCVLEDVARDDGFLALIEEGGPLARDLMGPLLKRIS